jgi:hypothetical protein
MFLDLPAGFPATELESPDILTQAILADVLIPAAAPSPRPRSGRRDDGFDLGTAKPDFSDLIFG